MIHSGPDGATVLPRSTFSKELRMFIPRAMGLLKALAIEPALSVCLSLVGVDGVELSASQDMKFSRNMIPVPFRRSELLFRDILITDWEQPGPEGVVKMLLDEVWQASGFARCYDYDDMGQWKPLK